MSSGNGPKIEGTSLRNRVLIPFFTILLVLGSAATIGTILIISGTLKKTADERLEAFQQVIYHEIRDLEARLLRRINLLELSYRFDKHNQQLQPEDLQDIELLIEESLVSEGMSARYISPKASEKFNDGKLSELLNLARVSGKPQIRFTTDIGPHPALTVVRPLFKGNVIDQYIVIQAELGTDYLNKVSAPLNLKTALFDLSGDFLVGSQSDHAFIAPGHDVLSKTLDGQNIFSSYGTLQQYRNLYYAIPLGTTDMLIVLLEMPLADISTIVSALATRSAISIFIAMVIGGFIYFKVINQLMKPAQSMLLATKAIGDGNLDYRIEEIAKGEMGQLASGFNAMMQNISELYNAKIENERELTKAQEELKYKAIVEDKNKAIEEINEELTEHLAELSTLLQLNQAMASTLDLDLLFDRVINSLSELLDCNMASLLIYNPGEELLELRYTLGMDQEILTEVSFSLNEGVSGEAARTHSLIYVKDLKKDNRYLKYKGKLPAKGSLLSIPLLSKDRLCGVLNLHKENISGFDKDDIKLAQAVANQAAVAIENSQLYEQAKTQSITDELTGLSNRRHFQDILQREIVHAQRYSSNISMIMADIDNFKSYNDAHGHLQGDIALKKVANILLQNTRGIDLVARFGGEEFVVLLPQTTIAGARITAEKLREKIEEEVFSGADESQPSGRLTMSFGLATYPDHTPEMEQLLELADQALYKAKETGRNRVLIWTDGLRSTG